MVEIAQLVRRLETAESALVDSDLRAAVDISPKRPYPRKKLDAALLAVRAALRLLPTPSPESGTEWEEARQQAAFEVFRWLHGGREERARWEWDRATVLEREGCLRLVDRIAALLSPESVTIQRVDRNEDGTLDGIVWTGPSYLEDMGDGRWCLTAGRGDLLLHITPNGAWIDEPREHATQPPSASPESAARDRYHAALDAGLSDAEAREEGWPRPESERVRLPDLELVAAAVHDAWMEAKRALGVESRKSESGEELMVPYAALSEQAKELDRSTVRAVYAAIHHALSPATPEPTTPADPRGLLERGPGGPDLPTAADMRGIYVTPEPEEEP